MKINEVISLLNRWAPPSYQESYDNARLIVGDSNAELTSALISLDCTEIVVEEAIEKGANLIIAHHPIVFKGLKSLTGKTYVERTILKAIKNEIAIFSIHTNLDNVNSGVNKKICDLVQLNKCKILAPKSNTLTKLVTFVPPENKDEILKKLYAVGAGNIGNYDQCSFQIEGTGTFRPNQKATPYTGTPGKQEWVNESRIELVFEAHRQSKIIDQLKNSHPYEEVAYYLTDLKNSNQDIGAGMIGELEKEIDTSVFFENIKKTFNLKLLKHTNVHKDKVRKIAVCGGSGSFLLGKAIREGADVFITSDFKYHEYFDADNRIIIADIGHYESEVFTKELIYDFLIEKIPNIAVNLSERVTNPINYF
ncbi:MAG: Nif3-like dinuclear metal center hexameric protein [Reichenbachiella sp.]